MVDDINLDSLVTESNNNVAHTSENMSQDASRPRLKKIKRPKIRPQPDIPVAPAKLEAEKLKSDSDIDSEPIAEPEAPVLTEEENAVGTALMTATAAQNLANEEAQRNPYVLEGLPPDLDFNGDIPPEYDMSSYIRKNVVISIASVCLVIGVVLGFLFAPKGSEQHGLEDVAWNDETPKGRVRCGKTDSTQACTFYVLNSYRQELTGRDFYALAAKMTGREEVMIETSNMQYTTTKIKPGFFAQINIPALQ